MSFFNKLLKLERNKKILIVIIIDVIISIFSTWISFSVRLDTFHLPNRDELTIYLLAIVLFIPIFFVFGLYSSIFRYGGITSLPRVLYSCLFYAILFFLIILAIHKFDSSASVEYTYILPRSLGILQPILMLFFVSLSRISAYIIINTLFISKNKKRYLIYGAGKAGASFDVSNFDINILGFIDDDKNKINKKINGKNIFSFENFEELIKNLNISNILIAIPSLSFNKRRELISKLSKFNIDVKILPSTTELIDGIPNVGDFRSIDIDDLLDRKVNLETEDHLFFQNKVVLVTGAGGSIGEEICLQLMKLNLKKIILIDNSEFNLYKISNKIKRLNTNFDIKIYSKLTSIRNKLSLVKIFKEHCPDIVFHSAAYKHVPMIEDNPEEAISNNIIGTKNVVETAISNNVKNFILVSTDKAVRPTNIMGASKRVAELYVQANANINDIKKTVLSIVRFGNVLDSSGSVVPLFREQISSGGPITVTHKDITRYFMTIPEAARLVIQSSTISTGGEVFVLDMGKPIKILELAYKMIRLSGLEVKNKENPNGDIEIDYIGLRPGEKLYEELLISADAKNTERKYIFKANEHFTKLDSLNKVLDEMLIQKNLDTKEMILKNLKKIIPEFNHKANDN